jgi:hypothetical protein
VISWCKAFGFKCNSRRYAEGLVDGEYIGVHLRYLEGKCPGWGLYKLNPVDP